MGYKVEKPNADDPPTYTMRALAERRERGREPRRNRALARRRKRLVRFREGTNRLAVEADRDRLLALLSVAFRRPVAADVLRHVEAASTHWRRGDKALANLRLVFSDLPRLDTPADAQRLRAVEYLLDEGLAPRDLMTKLGLDTAVLSLSKYDPDQPRVPAGSGRESGRWTDSGGGAPAKPPSTVEHGVPILPRQPATSSMLAAS